MSSHNLNLQQGSGADFHWLVLWVWVGFKAIFSKKCFDFLNFYNLPGRRALTNANINEQTIFSGFTNFLEVNMPPVTSRCQQEGEHGTYYYVAFIHQYGNHISADDPKIRNRDED
jgi:hypothetical protein